MPKAKERSIYLGKSSYLVKNTYEERYPPFDLGVVDLAQGASQLDSASSPLGLGS